MRFLLPCAFILSCVAPLLAASGPALSAALPGGASSLTESHGDWQVLCKAPEDAVRCSLSQTQARGEDRRRLLAVELTSDDGRQVSGTLVLPFGLKLDAGVELAVDEDGARDALRFSTCLPDGCLVPLLFDKSTVAALRAGETLIVTAVANSGEQEVVFSISLAGFSSALDRVTELGGF